MSQAAPRVLIASTNIENRDFLLSADHIIRSQRAPGSPASPGKDFYVLQMSNGSEITLLKEECDQIIHSKFFTIEKSEVGNSPW